MTFLPQLTRRVAMEGSGCDPLGLTRVPDALSKVLLPNIITTTDRARYYFLFTWAIADFEAMSNTNRRRIFRLRRRIDLPIADVRQVGTILASVESGDNLETDFRVSPGK